MKSESRFNGRRKLNAPMNLDHERPMQILNRSAPAGRLALFLILSFMLNLGATQLRADDWPKPSIGGYFWLS